MTESYFRINVSCISHIHKKKIKIKENCSNEKHKL